MNILPMNLAGGSPGGSALSRNWANPPKLEMWGGPECSYVRVGDRFVDQFASSGHDGRLDDLDRFAALGIRALRYPISWERMMKGHIDWAWAEQRLERLRALEIRPILGFVHHGGGPHPEGLLSPDFAPGLAEFARQVSERFPWVDAYTPLNEPLSTARFSGLYGFWHPHGQSMECFARCLVHQAQATRLAMRAIREVNPAAILVQTEDVGKTHSIPDLAYQADFENERRWLSFDLICGKVHPGHPLFTHLRDHGISEAELGLLCESPCAPDIMGINHYVTSERFLDDRLHLYENKFHGGNGRHTYADVEAVRVRLKGVDGPAIILQEVWDRYNIPLAITEVQLAGPREEQLRWLLELWGAAQGARAKGIDIRAVTAWALLGAYEWDSLLTETRGSYENGAFDLRGPVPRPTIIASAVQSLASGQDFSHPVLAQPGWWRRPERLIYPSYPASRPDGGKSRGPIGSEAERPVLIINDERGGFGPAFVQGCAHRALRAHAIVQTDIDLTQPDAVAALLDGCAPWAVIDCSSHADINRGKSGGGDRAALVAGVLAKACADRDAKFLTFSSYQVFDGSLARPYVESDQPRPLNRFGQGQHEAERRGVDQGKGVLIVRTGACFGSGDASDFVFTTLRDLAASKAVFASAQTISPTFVPDMVHHALDLLVDGEAGVWHLANAGPVTWLDWGRAIARIAQYPEALVRESRRTGPEVASPLPGFSALGSERGPCLPPWQHSLERYLRDNRQHGGVAA